MEHPDSEQQSQCERCNNPFCLGTFFHDWVDSDDSLLQVFQSYHEPTDEAALVDDDGVQVSEPTTTNDNIQPPSPKRSRFHNATDEELKVAAVGIVPKNTESNNRWALRNFEAWRAHYNRLHPDT